MDWLERGHWAFFESHYFSGGWRPRPPALQHASSRCHHGEYHTKQNRYRKQCFSTANLLQPLFRTDAILSMVLAHQASPRAHQTLCYHRHAAPRQFAFTGVRQCQTPTTRDQGILKTQAMSRKLVAQEPQSSDNETVREKAASNGRLGWHRLQRTDTVKHTQRG